MRALPLIALALASAACQPSVEERGATAKSVIDRYCADCHNDAERTAELTLERFALTDVGAHAEIWETVVHKLRGRMMPPAGEPLPAAEVTDELVDLSRGAARPRGRGQPEPGDEVAASLEPHGVRQRDSRSARARDRRDGVSAERQRGLRLRQHRRRARHRPVADGSLPLRRVEDHERRARRYRHRAGSVDLSRPARPLAARSGRGAAARHAWRHAREPPLSRRRRVRHQAAALAQHRRRRARHRRRRTTSK